MNDMGDLISRSALLQEFETENVAHNSDLWHITGIKAFIENAPTAYDVEAVVEELKDATQYVKYHGVETETRAIHPIQAIDIVRKGGVHE